MSNPSARVLRPRSRVWLWYVDYICLFRGLAASQHTRGVCRIVYTNPFALTIPLHPRFHILHAPPLHGTVPHSLHTNTLHTIHQPPSCSMPLCWFSFCRRPRGFGFIEYRDPRDAEDALYELDGSTLLGRQLSVSMLGSQYGAWCSWPTSHFYFSACCHYLMYCYSNSWHAADC